ncbi:MAG: excinuclease ABC subunit UvrC [Bacteroidaceae bacterium]|nr:excinuclease ABC subunit UvrC [Bacteroidaceae bacterium]
MRTREEHIKSILQRLPESPGSYQYFDEHGTVIYVGKAKNLKRRVSSYFNREHDSRKTAILVSKIYDIHYTVVKTEAEALLLENQLIKQFQPRYNVLLKDGKSYPSIAVTKEYLPRIFKTRHIDRKGAIYFGPYSHIPTINGLLELFKNLYPIRRCHQPMTREGVENGKYKLCLEYHMKNCFGPCVGLQSHEEYMDYINAAIRILKGDTAALRKEMLAQMQQLATEMKFEEAQIVKRRYDLITAHQEKSQIITSTGHNIDVFSIDNDERIAYINYLHVVEGAINQAFTFEYKKKLDESEEELLVRGIMDMRDRWGSEAKEIVLPFHVELPLEDIEITIPQRGDKKQLLALSELNVRQYKVDRLKQQEKLNPEQKAVRLMKEIQDHLKLPTLPYQIECFDNSNISGTDAVAGCVVFKKCKPSKADYRKYNIKTVVGPDDYASMQEVVRRRYSRMKEEGTQLPDLIITDGGAGQMSVVREVVEGELGLAIPIAGLAKDDRHRTHELLYGNPPMTVALKQDSALFRLLTQIQDEVHRYAITFHRDKRSKSQLRSELDSIPGIGPKTKQTLLKAFKSVKRIREASEEELSKVIGDAKTKAVKRYFAQQSGESENNE